jgi:hypothetical protein
MALALLTFGVAFAAFCVWLTVRIVNRRERWAKRMLAIAVCFPVLYALSFGPACWLFSRRWMSIEAIEFAYSPILWTHAHGPTFIAKVVGWYIGLGMPQGAHLVLRNGESFILL